MFRLRTPATEQEAIANALRVLEAQTAQLAGRMAETLSSAGAGEQLERTRRMLDETRILMEQLLGREREALMRQQQELQREIARVNQAIERMSRDLRKAAGDAPGRR